MSKWEENNFRLDSRIYSPDVILNSARGYSEFADVKIIEVNNEYCEVAINVKNDHVENAVKIKGELLNHIIGSSWEKIIGEIEP